MAVIAWIYAGSLACEGRRVLALLMFSVVRGLARDYEEMAGGLPLFSRLLLTFGKFVGNHAWPIAMAMVVVVSLGIYFLTRASFRAALNARLWRIPMVGERMKVYQLARLYRTAGMLLRASIPAVRALDMVKDLLAAHLRPQLVLAKTQIEQGKPMSVVLGAAGLATPVATPLIVVSERGGDMGGMLGQ